MAILQIRDITKQYYNAKEFALKGVSLEVGQGEILGLVGASGSGKTTLLRLIAGLEHPESGSILLKGNLIVDGHKSVPAHKRKVGMVFQDYALFPHLTIIENVKYGLAKSGADKTAKEILSMVGINDQWDKYPHQLSGGQQQRVALARTMAPQPSIILLDEPFSNLDEVLKDQVRDEIRQIIKKMGTTAIFVTHDTKDALTIADRIAILKDGKLHQIGTPRQLYNEPVNQYVASFFGKMNKIAITPTPHGYQSSFGEIVATNSDKIGVTTKMITFRPEQATMGNGEGYTLEGEIVKLAWYGNSQIITLKSGKGEEIEINCRPEMNLNSGENIVFHLKKFDLVE